MCPFETIEVDLYSLGTVFQGRRIAGSQGGGGEEREQPSHIQVRL